MLLTTMGLVGCSDTEGPTSPSAISETSQASSSNQGPAATPASLGYVMDTALRRLAGAQVEIVDGPQAGAVMTTDAQGQFVLAGPFLPSNTFRASKDGYRTATQGFATSAPGGTPYLLFYLQSDSPTVNIAGDYTLTLAADSACVDLPSELHTRSYAATVMAQPTPTGPSETSFKVAVRDVSVLDGLDGLTIGVSGNSLGLWLHGGHDPTLVEQLGPNTYLAYSGLGWANFEPSVATTISGTFEGWIDYCVMPSPMGNGYNCGTSNFTGEPLPGASITRLHCDATSHRLILTRR